MSKRRGVWAGAAVVTAALGALAFGARSSGPAPASRAPAREPSSTGTVTEPAPEPPPPPAHHTAPGASSHHRPVSAAAPPGCPDADADPEGFVRPSVWELLRLRTQELRDRLPELSREGSPALREGLAGVARGNVRGAEGLLEAPDRVQDGFDVAVAALLHLGMKALAEERLREARQQARAAAREAPGDAAAHALLALVAERMDDPGTARREMAFAVEREPDDPALALALSRLETDFGRFDRAARLTGAYLDAVPEDGRTRAFSERLAARAELTRDHRRRTRGGLTVLWPEGAVEQARVDALAEQVDAVLDRVARLSGHPRRAELTVVIYHDRDELRRATCAPAWSGGLFDGVLHLSASRLGAPGERWRRVVRHEATHAQLSTVRGRIPTWLNEGLAQWMEGPPLPGVLASWRRMVRDRVWIPFPSLEGQLVVIDDAGDAGLAYHQSLAMVRFLLDRRGEGSIGEAVSAIEAGQAQDLMSRLLGGRSADGRALLAYLDRVEVRSTAATPRPRR